MSKAGLSLRTVGVTVAYVLFAVGFCFVPAVGIEWFSTSRPIVVVGSIITAIMLGAVHLMRMRWPATVAVVGLGIMVAEAAATGATSVGAILIECDALYNLVIARSAVRSQRILSGIASACLSLAVLGLLFANALPAPVVQANILLLAAGVTLWWALSVRIPTAQAEQERERSALIAAAADAKQREALAAERLQISRELHDTISGHLSAIAMQSAAAMASPTPLDADALAARLAQVRSLSLDAMADMRTLIEVLRTDASSPVALPQNWSDVTELIERMRESGTAVTLTGEDPGAARLDPLTSVAAYNVVRESLVNSNKHAPGSPVTVETRIEDDRLQILVTNGRGAASLESVSSGYGLIGLAERVRLCGGAIEVDAGADSWVVRATLPQTTERTTHHA